MNMLQAEAMKLVEFDDANAAIEYFEAKRTTYPSLYMEIDYAYFGDVFAFNMTCKNNVTSLTHIQRRNRVTEYYQTYNL
ncbi:hypothetical protein EPI10_005361 [Gossypium australe]|uniref:Uncharacterized protein n=1 Tax=Gossypium australe TaxID=47621 RepID=A0A5B6WPA3_9ROSI|nr:hypothetical protein EPI10_005361 [Gossypium australe]